MQWAVPHGTLIAPFVAWPVFDDRITRVWCAGLKGIPTIVALCKSDDNEVGGVTCLFEAFGL